MTAVQFLADLAQRGIEVVAHGDRLTYRLRSTMTSDLVERMGTLKPELLAISSPGKHTAKATTGRPDEVEERQEVELPAFQWENTIDPPDPCPECRGLELWKTMAGNWRCLRCDPPIKVRRLRKLAARLKTDRTDSTRLSPMGDQ